MIDVLKIFIIVLTIVGFLMINSNNKKGSFFFCTLSCLVLSFLSAIRAENVGTDTISYIAEYNYVSKESYLFILSNYQSCFGFYWFAKICQNTGLPVNFWFFLIALLFNSSIFCFIYKFSKNCLLSFILYIGLGVFAFSLAGLKQIMAMSFCIFSVMVLNKKHGLLFSIFLVLVAATFHQSALFFIVILLILKLKPNKKLNIIFSILFLFLIIFGGNHLKGVILYLADIGNRFGHYSSDISDVNLTMFFINAVLIFVCLVCYKYLIIDKLNSSIYALLIALVFFFLTTIVSSMFRMGLYLSFFIFALYPNVVERIRDRSLSRMISFGTGLAYLLYFLIFTNINYSTI